MPIANNRIRVAMCLSLAARAWAAAPIPEAEEPLRAGMREVTKTQGSYARLVFAG